MFQELEFTIGSFGEDRSAERLHNLLDRNRLLCELVFGGAVVVSTLKSEVVADCIPNKTKGTHADRLQVGVPEPGVSKELLADCTRIPAGDLKGRAEDLGSHKLSHLGTKKFNIWGVAEAIERFKRDSSCDE